MFDNKILVSNNKMSENNFIIKKDNLLSKKNEKKESFLHIRSNSVIESNNNLSNINLKKKNKNKNIFNKNISSSNIFSKNIIMRFNTKNRNYMKLNTNNIIISNPNIENTHNNYTDTKRIKQLNIDNSHNLKLKMTKNYIYPKITNNILLDYKNKNKKNEIKKSNTCNDIRSNSYNNIKEYNKKPKNELIKDINYYNNKLKIKFTNIIKEKFFGKKFFDLYLKYSNETKKRRKIPSLTDNLNIYVNNFNDKIFEDSFYQRHKRFFSKNKLKRKINLSEKKKIFYGDFKTFMNLSNKNIFDFKYKNSNHNSNKINIKKICINNMKKSGSKSCKSEK